MASSHGWLRARSARVADLAVARRTAALCLRGELTAANIGHHVGDARGGGAAVASIVGGAVAGTAAGGAAVGAAAASCGGGDGGSDSAGSGGGGAKGFGAAKSGSAELLSSEEAAALAAAVKTTAFAAATAAAAASAAAAAAATDLALSAKIARSRRQNERRLAAFLELRFLAISDADFGRGTYRLPCDQAKVGIFASIFLSLRVRV